MGRREINSRLRISLAVLQRCEMPGMGSPSTAARDQFHVTSSQASDSEKAPTELMTNMVDAVLLMHAYLKQSTRGPPSVEPEPCSDWIVVPSASSV
jgi:hypothetical protein